MPASRLPLADCYGAHDRALAPAYAYHSLLTSPIRYDMYWRFEGVGMGWLSRRGSGS